MTRKITYLLLLLLVTVFWGITFPMIKESLYYISPLNFLFLRFALSSALMIPLIARSKGVLMKGPIMHGIAAGVLLFIGYYFQTVGLEYTTSARSGIITGLYVVLVPLFSLVLLRTRPGVPVSMACVFSFLGLLIMSAGSIGSQSIQYGDILTIFCAVAYALQIIYVSRYSKEVETYAFTFYQLLVVAILSGSAIPFSGPGTLSFPEIVIFTLIFTAVFAGVFAVYISNVALIHVEASAAGIIFVGEPIFAAIASVIMLGETLTIYTVAGGVIMVLSMFLVAYDKYRKEKSCLREKRDPGTYCEEDSRT